MGAFSTVVVLVLWVSSDVSHALGELHDTGGSPQNSAVTDNDLSFRGQPYNAGAREILQITGDTAHRTSPGSRFPYACSLRADESGPHVCSGTLIAPKLVLTAAQCVSGKESAGPTPIVHFGGDKKAIQSVRVIVHQQWTGNTNDGYDIALVELEEALPNETPLLIGSHQPIGMNQIMVSLGWGETSNVNSKSRVLQVADGRQHVDNRNCKNVWLQLKNNMMCAHDNPEASCEGDAGDPLIIADTNGSSNFGPGNPTSDVMVGVLSMKQEGCEELRNGFARRPSVFTRLSSFFEWIQENTESPQADSKQAETTSQRVPASVGGSAEGVASSADAFLKATKDGDLEAVKREVENGVDMEARLSGMGTALIIASANHPDIVKYLLEKGANLEARDELGFTPAIVLAFFGRTEALQLCLDRGVDVEAKTNEGAAALFYAAERNHLGALKALLDAGADVDVRFERTGATPLMIAAERSNIDIVQELISGGADVDVENNVRKTPLHSAAQGPKNRDVIFALIDAGADVNGQDQDGHTALHYATWNGRKDNYDALLSRGADAELLTTDIKAPLDMVCLCKNTTPSKRTNCFFEFCENDEAEVRAAFG